MLNLIVEVIKIFLFILGELFRCVQVHNDLVLTGLLRFGICLLVLLGGLDKLVVKGGQQAQAGGDHLQCLEVGRHCHVAKASRGGLAHCRLELL